MVTFIRKISLILILSSIVLTYMKAQSVVNQKSTSNFYEIQKKFNEKWAGKKMSKEETHEA